MGGEACTVSEIKTQQQLCDISPQSPYTSFLPCSKYYDRLNKTYVIVDLSRYHKHQVGMRWRTPKEVSRGTGQFICAAVGCEAARHLTSLEVPFSYKEHAVLKHALVKARLCPVCTQKLLAASPRGSKGGLRSGDSSRVQAVLKAAAASSTHTVQDSATMHTGGAAIGARKRARAASSATGDEGVGNQGGGNSLQQGGSHKTRRASSDRTSPEELRNTRSPSAASAASVASRGAASVGSAAVNGLSDEALLRRLLR